MEQWRTPENCVVNPDEYVWEIPKEQQFDDSAKVVNEADRSDFSDSERDRLREAIRKRGDKSLLDLNDEEFDLALGFLQRNSSGVLKPTVCGLLMIGRTDSLQKFLPTARSVFQRLVGGRVVTDKTFLDPIVATIEQMTVYFEAYNASKEAYIGGVRYVIPDYSLDAFREGLANALCHRNYSVFGQVRVLLTENSLSIINPGGFVPSITINNLLYAEPHSRNKLLAQALKRVGYAERTKRGIDTIFIESMRGGRLWPDYSQSTDSYIKLEILKSKEEYDFFRLVNQYELILNRTISVPAMMILSLLRNEGPKLHLSELMDSLPKIFTKEKIRMEANQMVADKILLSEGNNRDPSYRIVRLDALTTETPSGIGKTILVQGDSEKAAENQPNGVKSEPTKKSKTEVNLPESTTQEILAYVQEHVMVTSTEWAEAAGISRQSAYRHLSHLVQKGLLETVGGRRNRAYRKRNAE